MTNPNDQLQSQPGALTLTPRLITRGLWDMVQAIAPSAVKARFYDGITAADQAAIVMLKGYELGLPLMAAFEFIQVIQGRPALSPRGALALIYQSRELTGFRIEESDPPGQWCRVWMQRRNGVEYTCTWTIEDAQRAGLVKAKGNWEAYPANMLRWRAIGFCADIVFPDILGGLKRADEFGAAIDEAGNVLPGLNGPESQVINTQPVQRATEAETTEPEEAAAAMATLEGLVERYGAEAVVEANGGRIPATTEDVHRVAKTLAATGA